jgi:hypothetical protein
VSPNGPGTQGFNPYAYAGNSPVTLTDPSGMLPGGDTIKGGVQDIIDIIECILWGECGFQQQNSPDPGGEGGGGGSSGGGASGSRSVCGTAGATACPIRKPGTDQRATQGVPSFPLRPTLPEPTDHGFIGGMSVNQKQALFSRFSPVDRLLQMAADEPESGSSWTDLGSKAWEGSLQLGAFAAYGTYCVPYQYFEYRNRAIDRLPISEYYVYPLLLPWDIGAYALEAVGLAADIAIDLVIQRTVPGSDVRELNDEGKFTGALPDPIAKLIFGDPNFPMMWAPGWHCDQCDVYEPRDPGRVDFHFLWWDHFYLPPSWGNSLR